MFCLSEFIRRGKYNNTLFRLSDSKEDIYLWTKETIEQIEFYIYDRTLTTYEKEDQERSNEIIEELNEYLKNGFIVCSYIYYD